MIEASGLKMIPVEDFNSAAKTVSFMTCLVSVQTFFFTCSIFLVISGCECSQNQ